MSVALQRRDQTLKCSIETSGETVFKTGRHDIHVPGSAPLADAHGTELD